MKKFISTVLVALMAIGAEAQVTWNVRAGACLIGDSHYGEILPGFRLNVQANIPFGADERWVFSPSVGYAQSIGDNDGYTANQLDIPLMIGRKVVIGPRALFVPKVGPVLGVETNSGSFIAAPGAELAFEIGHFVVAVSGYYSLITVKEASAYFDYEMNPYNAALTLGYKF